MRQFFLLFCEESIRDEGIVEGIGAKDRRTIKKTPGDRDTIFQKCVVSKGLSKQQSNAKYRNMESSGKFDPSYVPNHVGILRFN